MEKKVSRQLHKLKDAGSSPAPATNIYRYVWKEFRGVERRKAGIGK